MATDSPLKRDQESSNPGITNDYSITRSIGNMGSKEKAFENS